MKIAANRVDTFAGKPDPAARAVLVFGADAGLVRERVDKLVRGVVEDLADPFRVCELTAAVLKDDPARLADEAAAIALTGGRRVVRVRDAGDSLTQLIGRFLDNPIGDALIVVEAGALEARSSLKKLFEGADNAASLACYAAEGAELQRFVVETLRQHGLMIADDALEFLVAHLGGDRMVTRSELDKLALYLGAAAKTATFDDVTACVGDSAALALDDVILAAFDGAGETMMRALSRAGFEGINAVAILRAAQRHAQRLHLALGFMAQGQTPESAMRALRPPVFFRAESQFRAQLRTWSARQIATIMERLVETEARCKTTGAPAEALCGQALAEIGLIARNLARRSAA
ncbi:MAG: DNA polymerase III subunit delta [Alphaproteobacteria bacterium]|nr:DNA polymerase III subunit delta [Alphaproteobacteria bacterium]